MIFLLFLVSSVHEAISDGQGLERKIHELLEKSVCVSDCIGSVELGEITRHVRNKGLHRELVTTVQLPELVSSDVGHNDDNCGVMLIEQLPEGIYVDTDEVAGLSRFGGPKLLHFEPIDVEKPAHLSYSHTIVVYGNLSEDNNSLWSADIRIPIHLRYHPPNYGGIPPAVNLSSPLVLVSCLPGLVWKQQLNYSDCSRVCKGGNKLEGPCWWNTSVGDCNWQLLPYQTPDALVFHIAVGDTRHWTLVVAVTFTVTILCCMTLCWAIWQVRIQSVSKDHNE